MANLEILTLNEAGDGWIDSLPGDASTGYQAQNTNFTARTLGNDLSSLKIENSTAIISQFSGSIDIAGVPYVMKEDVVFSQFSAGANFIEIVDTALVTEKNLNLTPIPPTWNNVKHYFETSAGNRVLNYVITSNGAELTARALSMGHIQNSTESLSGIGIGERRAFPVPGNYTLTVAHKGKYELFAIGARSYLTAGQTRNGGTSARAILALEIGDTISISVASSPNTSTIDVPSKIAISAPWLQGASVVPSIPIIESETHVSSEGGGGAGRYSDGGLGSSGGISRVETFGSGWEGNGNGFAEIVYISA